MFCDILVDRRELLSMSTKKSLSDSVYEDLKQKILLNHLHPGDLIAESALVEQYYISRTPIRQALKKLEDRGLVTIQDGVGTFVTFITHSDVQNAYEIRNAVEKIAIRTSMNVITTSELDNLEEQFLTLKKQLSRGGYGASLDKIAKADWELHDLIVDKCNNTYIPAITERINLVLRRYQYTNVSTFERAIDEHLEIISLIRARDLEKLLLALDNHIQFKPI